MKQKMQKQIQLNTLYNNTNIIEKLSMQKKRKQNLYTDTQSQKTKWATFTYNDKETRKITKLFRDTKLKIAVHTKNTIQNILRPQPQTN
jgi:hypothetical protein